jgi:sec-independent protein translocase protein TatC
MSVSAPPPPTEERPRDDGRNLTILEHLQELRRRLMICAGAVGVSLVIAVFLANPTLRWLKVPAESRVENFELVFTQPLEYWTTFFRVMLLLAICFSMPVFVWQALSYIGPGLTRNEKRWAYPIVLGASLMFVAGCAFAYYVELPPALNFLLDAPEDVATPFISVRSYVDFATRLMFVTGLVFEMPLVVMALAKIGLVNSRSLLHWWRFALVGAFVLSAVVTPSIDPITQTLVALPMIVLYFVGIGLAKLVESRPIIPRT